MNSIVLPKGLNLDLIKSLDPAANLQEMQRKEEYAELHHEYAISQIYSGKLNKWNSPAFFKKSTVRQRKGWKESP